MKRCTVLADISYFIQKHRQTEIWYLLWRFVLLQNHFFDWLKYFCRSSLSSTADINVDNNVEEMVFETPKIVYAKEVIVEDEVPVRQCEPGLLPYCWKTRDNPIKRNLKITLRSKVYSRGGQTFLLAGQIEKFNNTAGRRNFLGSFFKVKWGHFCVFSYKIR
jgi:hypothetical protein